MISKKLTIVNGQTGKEIPVSIAEGVTPNTLLQSLGFTYHALAGVKDRKQFGSCEDLFKEVKDGDRLFAFARAEFGGLRCIAG
jgi:hypothetical protein